MTIVVVSDLCRCLSICYLDLFAVTAIDQQGADFLCFHVSARCYQHELSSVFMWLRTAAVHAAFLHMHYRKIWGMRTCHRFTVPVSSVCHTPALVCFWWNSIDCITTAVASSMWQEDSCCKKQREDIKLDYSIDCMFIWDIYLASLTNV